MATLEEDLPEMDNLCANCCQSLITAIDNGNKNDDNVDLMNISESLSSIYKLHYLTSMSDISSLYLPSYVMKLCDDCLNVFTSLQKFYHDFNQLRTLESFLSKEIQKLDDCIKAKEIITRNIKREPQDDENVNTVLENRHNSEVSSLPISESIHCSSSSSSFGPGPWVVIQRLEDDPIARTAIAHFNKTRHKRKALNKTIVPNVKAAKVVLQTGNVLNMENNDDDDEFVPLSPELDSDNEITSNDDQLGFSKSKRKTSRTQASSNKKISSKSKLESITCVMEENNQYSKSSKDNSKKKEEKKLGTKQRKPRGKYKSKCKVKKQSPVEEKAEEEMIQSINGRVLKLTGTPEERRHERRGFDKIYRRRKTKVPNPCWYCDLDFPTQEECFNHTMQKHFETGHYICKLCSNLSNTKGSFVSHQKYCKILNPGKILIGYQCDKCDYSSPFKYYVDNHIFAHHGEKQWLYCTHGSCPFKTQNPMSFKVHVRQQHSEKNETVEERTCTICEPHKVLKNKLSLHNHIQNMHTEHGHKKYLMYKETRNEHFREISKQKQANKTTICSECNIDLLTFLALTLHRKDFHQKNLTHVCEMCGTFFSRSSALRRHQEFVHSNFRPFTCHICGKSFKSTSNLKDHISSHSEEGRRAFNARMRAKNARRKIRNQSLAKLNTNNVSDHNATDHNTIDNQASSSQSQCTSSIQSGNERTSMTDD